MKVAGALLLVLTEALLRAIALPFLALGFMATPILWCARQCQTRAREWDPRLWERDQHTDLRPPP